MNALNLAISLSGVIFSAIGMIVLFNFIIKKDLNKFLSLIFSITIFTIYVIMILCLWVSFKLLGL